MMQDAVSHARVGAVAELLDHAALPLVALTPHEWSHEHLRVRGAALPSGAACHAVLAFMHISMSALLPVLVSAWQWYAAAEAESAAATNGGGSSSSSSRAATPAEQPATRSAACRAGVRTRVSGGAAAANLALARLLCGRLTLGGRAPVAWLVLAATWLCCRALALAA